jgi:hypothetical protein
MAKKINNEKDLRNLTKETSVVVEDALRSIADSVSGIFKQALEETQDVSKSLVRDTTSSLNSLAKVSSVLATNMEKAANGALKQSDILKTIQDRQAKIKAIEAQLAIVGVNSTKSKEKLEKQLKKIQEYEVEVNKQLQQQLELSERVNKNMGVTGNILKGISKIPILGNFIDAEEALIAAQKESAKQGATRSKAMGAAFSQMGKTIKEKLTDPLILFGVGLSIFKSLIDLGLKYDQITADIARNQGISTSEAEKTQNYLREAASNSQELLATTQNFALSQAALNDAFGTSADFSAKTLEDFTNLTKKLGLTNEEASVFAGFSATTGKTSEQIVNSIGKQNKGVINNKKVISEVAKINGQLYAQYKGSPIELAKAVIQTQKLGMSLQQASSASKNLLNFEESISAELEAELLTGRDLNLEKARYLALQGDSAGAAAELMKNVGSLKDFTKLNVIQQEALAKAVGMSADELTDSLRKQEQLKELNQGQVKLYQKQIQELRDKGRIEEANALEQQMLQGKSFELSKIQLSAQEKLSAAADKLKDTFAAIVAGPVGGFVSKFVDIIAKIASTKLGQIALGGAAIVALGTAILAMTRVFGKMAILGAMPVIPVGGGGVGGGDITGGLGGGGKASLGKQLKTAFTKPGVLGRALGGTGGGGMGKLLLKGAGKATGGIGALIGGLALDYFSSSQFEKASELEKEGKIKEAEKAKNIGKGLDVGSSALTGAGIGSTIGSIIPGLGTAIGAGVGGLIGAGYGAYQNYFADDFIVRPEEKQIIRTNPGDIIMGGTNLTGNSNKNSSKDSSEEMISLLKELINTVKSGGNVYLDGTKVGTAMNVSTYKVQ